MIGATSNWRPKALSRFDNGVGRPDWARGILSPNGRFVVLSGLFNRRLRARYLSHTQYRDSRGMRVSRFFIRAMPLHRPLGSLGRRAFVFSTPDSHRFYLLDCRTHRSLVCVILSKRTNFIFKIYATLFYRRAIGACRLQRPRFFIQRNGSFPTHCTRGTGRVLQSLEHSTSAARIGCCLYRIAGIFWHPMARVGQRIGRDTPRLNYRLGARRRESSSKIWDE